MKSIEKQTRDASFILVMIGIIVIILSLESCGSYTKNIIVTTSTSNSSETTIQEMVSQENEYRASIGEEPLTAGLDCTLYTVPQTTTQIVGATDLTNLGSFEYLGEFNQPDVSTTSGLNILPTNIQGLYQNWYIVKCLGTLVISDNNWHDFNLTSDDGSNLYINGLLINNDGEHSEQTVNASKFLGYGFYSFELDYFQATGNEALILEEDGNIMSNVGYYH